MNAAAAFLTISMVLAPIVLADNSPHIPRADPTPTYCATTGTLSAANPFATNDDLFPTVIPPIPCDGSYNQENGLCCAGGSMTCINGNCNCPAGTAWKLPLEPCVTGNPGYSGCPGNMMGGLCCSGPRIRMDSSRPACDGGASALFSISKNGAGATQTTTLGTYVPKPSKGAAHRQSANIIAGAALLGAGVVLQAL